MTTFEIRDQVHCPPYDQTWRQVIAQVSPAIYLQVRDDIYLQIANPVNNQVSVQIALQIVEDAEKQ